MKKEILSLKSLYRFLVISDYPIYSEGIINKNNHTGLTLTKFWQNNLLIDFRKHKCGKIIWRTEGGRNRYISEICNRSEGLRFYREYAEEIYNEAKPETVFRQIRQFMSFLLERQFYYDAFMKKLPAYIELLAKDDDAFSKEAVGFFNQNIKKQGRFNGKRGTEQAFLCGWLLTFLMFHALAGNGEGEDALRRLRNNPALSLEELEKAFLQDNEKKQEQVVFLSGKNTELCSTPLDARHFFGREEEMFELREMLARGGRYLVSGIGGIGKTELMRQFLKCCEEETLTEYICVVQYENSLVDSLIKAFPQIHGKNREENFYEALAIIRRHAGERILIVIDNMNHDQDEDEDINILSKIPATIFITSRYQKISGFETYPIRPISKKAGSLVFRDNYRKPLQKEDKQALEVILNNELWCHTLTLRLLGSVAGSRDWNLQELLKQLEKGVSPSGLEKQDGYEGLKQIYRRMYAASVLSDELNKLLKIFAALPYASYTLDFANRFLNGYLGGDTDMQKSLEQLWISGWLEKRDSGYSMHPFIAECVKSDVLVEKDVAPFFEGVIAAWEKSGLLTDWEQSLQRNWYGNVTAEEQKLRQVTLIVWAVTKELTGIIREKFISLIIMAAYVEYIECGQSKAGLEVLMDIKAKHQKIPDIMKIQLYTMLVVFGRVVFEELEEESRSLFDNPEIPKEHKIMLYFGIGMNYGIKGNYDKAEEIAKYIWENSDYPEQQMSGCILFAVTKHLKGDREGLGEWTKRGVEIGKKNIDCENSVEMLMLVDFLGDYYLSMYMYDEAENAIKKMCALNEKGGSAVFRWKCLFKQGSLEMGRGDKDYGVNNLLEALKLAEALYDGTVVIEFYAINLADLAMAYNKAGNQEEAVKYYERALAIYEDIPGREFDIHRVLNNMGVMYLDWGKPEEALDCLTKSWEIGKTMGGLPAAENGNNLSRAWRMLGDREKELFYLRDAAPVLERFYGSENPKVVDAKRRLSE